MKKGVDIWYLSAAGVFFGLFVLDVLLGKAALSFGFEPILKLGDVGEFLMLLAAVICFMIEALRCEAQQAGSKTKTANTAEEENA